MKGDVSGLCVGVKSHGERKEGRWEGGKGEMKS